MAGRISNRTRRQAGSFQRVASFRGYHVLMPYRVQEILVVASPYDLFILEEDGRFSDRISSDYMELKLSSPPQLDRVNTAGEAIDALREHRYDLVLTTGHFTDRSINEMATGIKEIHPDLPLVYLAFDRREAAEIAAQAARYALSIDFVFLWSGDPRILLALVKTVEDRMNVQHDTTHGLVRVILVVEDSPAFYSVYLPLLYTEVMEQTRRLMAERLNEIDRMFRMRARPKILLARSYEEAVALFGRYSSYLLGVITDMRFPRRGIADPTAGVDLIQKIRAAEPQLPVLLQSAEEDHERVCREMNVSFADKRSQDLLDLLRDFMVKYFGFGPFIFRNKAGDEIGRAEDTRELLNFLSRVPAESIELHAGRNNFSNWFMARSEFALADEIRPRRTSEFASLAEARNYLINAIHEFLERQQRGQVTDFAPEGHHLSRDFSRLGVGSLGGKARGIAFLAALLAEDPIHERYPELRVIVPRTTVVCTGVFEEHVTRNDLDQRAMAADSDVQIQEMFLAEPLNPKLVSDLSALLREVRYPLAVRSSSLLEDSRFQPFAGVYATYLLPNNHRSHSVRLDQLCEAIQLVYASTYMTPARDYMSLLSQRMEEERMAVVIQRLVGTHHGTYFYPDFAGVAKSRNYYPIDYMRPEDGIVTVALGLGRTVVEGRRALHFCPAYPKVPLHMATVDDALQYSQREFYALDLKAEFSHLNDKDAATLAELDLETAEAHGTLATIGATYDPGDHRIYDSIARDGNRLINFAGVLKYEKFPLASLLQDILSLSEAGVGTDIELEFAVCMHGRKRGKPELALVQMRPIVPELVASGTRLDELRPGESIFLAGQALGSGFVESIQDIVYVHPDRFDRTNTVEMARSIGKVNTVLEAERRPAAFLAPGRWGSADRFLGVPVNWHDISAARVMVEILMPGFGVEASQGSHFFHNITSLRVGYFTVDLSGSVDVLHLEWLEALAPLYEDDYVRHVRLPHPVQTRIQEGRGVLVVTEAEGASRGFASDAIG